MLKSDLQEIRFNENDKMQNSMKFLNAGIHVKK